MRQGPCNVTSFWSIISQTSRLVHCSRMKRKESLNKKHVKQGMFYCISTLASVSTGSFSPSHREVHVILRTGDIIYWVFVCAIRELILATCVFASSVPYTSTVYVSRVRNHNCTEDVTVIQAKRVGYNIKTNVLTVLGRGISHGEITNSTKVQDGIYSEAYDPSSL